MSTPQWGKRFILSHNAFALEVLAQLRCNSESLPHSHFENGTIAALHDAIYTEMVYPPARTSCKSIQVLGPGCPECRQLKADVETALQRLGIAADVEHVTEISRIIAMDVCSRRPW